MRVVLVECVCHRHEHEASMEPSQNLSFFVASLSSSHHEMSDGDGGDAIASRTLSLSIFCQL